MTLGQFARRKGWHSGNMTAESVDEDIRNLRLTLGNSNNIGVSLNVLDFGAKGDGVTDDTISIQAAINKAQLLFGGIVVFPVGTYKLTDTLRITNTVSLLGMGGTISGADVAYTTGASAPNRITGGVVIWQSTNNKNGLLIRQSLAATYKIQVRIEDITFVGQITASGTGPGGSSGDGIVVDPQDANFGARCIFTNVACSYFRGYGINMVEGYYGSSFNTIDTNNCGLTGFYTAGTNQGEWSMVNLRSFSNGTNGSTESDRAGLYIGSGGGIFLGHISCSGNYRTQIMISGADVNAVDLWTETFSSNDSSDRGLILNSCTVNIMGAAFSPQSSFLGKIIDARSVTTSRITNIRFLQSVNAAGYDIFEDGSCGRNIYEIGSVNGSLITSTASDTIYGFGSDLYRKGTTTNDDAADPGWIGEYVESVVTSQTSVGTSGQFADATSISLTSGDWDIEAIIELTANGATFTSTDFQMGVTTTSGNSATGISNGNNALEWLGVVPTTFTNFGMNMNGYRVKLASTTIHYLKLFVSTYTVGTPKYQCRLSARRRR